MNDSPSSTTTADTDPAALPAPAPEPEALEAAEAEESAAAAEAVETAEAEETTEGVETAEAGEADAAADTTSTVVSGGDELSAESVVEALLFSTDAPLPANKLAQLVGVGDARDMRRHIDSLNRRYAQTGASFRIEAIAGGFQMLTLPVYASWLGKLRKARSESRLSPAALETLAIVAYKQPVLRADVEAIRGVAVGDMLVRLREMNLVRITGRAEEIGRPLLYGTTRRFLEVFGLGSIKDLPQVDELTSANVPQLKLVEPEVKDEPPAGSDD